MSTRRTLLVALGPALAACAAQPGGSSPIPLVDITWADVRAYAEEANASIQADINDVLNSPSVKAVAEKLAADVGALLRESSSASGMALARDVLADLIAIAPLVPGVSPVVTIIAKIAEAVLSAFVQSAKLPVSLVDPMTLRAMRAAR